MAQVINESKPRTKNLALRNRFKGSPSTTFSQAALYALDKLEKHRACTLKPNKTIMVEPSDRTPVGNRTWGYIDCLLKGGWKLDIRETKVVAKKSGFSMKTRTVNGKIFAVSSRNL